MAQQDRRIPARPPATAPPPPRRLEAPQPEYLKPKTKPRKPVTRESIRKSQTRAIVIMIVLLAIFFIIFYAATVPITQEFPHMMDENTEYYTFEFTIPDLLNLDQNINTKIEVSASDDVGFYILNKEDYTEGMTIIQLDNGSINKNHRKTSDFTYEDQLEPGKYIVVAYLANNNQDISLDYTISRYVIMPFLGLVSLIFIILILICILRIFLLEKKKKDLLIQSRAGPDYAQPGYGAGPDHDPYYGQTNDYEHYDGPAASRHSRPPPSHASNIDYEISAPKRAAAYDARHEGHFIPEIANDPDRPQPQGQGGPGPRPPRPRAPRQPPPGGPREPASYPGTADPASGPPTPGPVTVPCKCGEIIRITDTTRPLQIRCTRCGRRGILEGDGRSPEDDIFY